MAQIPPSIPGIDPCINQAFKNLFNYDLPIRSLALDCETRVLTDHVYLQLLKLLSQTPYVQPTSLEGRGQKITLTDRVITIHQEALKSIALYMGKVPPMYPHLDLPLSFRMLAGNTIPNEWLVPDPVVSSEHHLREMNETLKQILAQLMPRQEAQNRPEQNPRSVEVKREQEPPAPPMMPLPPSSYPLMAAPGLRPPYPVPAVVPSLAYAHPGAFNAPAASPYPYQQTVDPFSPPPPQSAPSLLSIRQTPFDLGIAIHSSNVGPESTSRVVAKRPADTVASKASDEKPSQKRSRQPKGGEAIPPSSTSADIAKKE